jgi:hypothetical protein
MNEIKELRERIEKLEGKVKMLDDIINHYVLQKLPEHGTVPQTQYPPLKIYKAKTK